MSLTDKQRAQGRVLQRAHELLERNPGMTIGQAIARAVQAADVEVPQEIQTAMVSALGKLLIRGFPSNVDA